MLKLLPVKVFILTRGNEKSAMQADQRELHVAAVGDATGDAVVTARQSILHFLLIQTYLDGGSCYATAYRDSYDSNNALPNLLRAAKYGKLLQFMESKHPRQYMSISDRSKPPHIVSLTDDGRKMAVKLVEEFLGNSAGEYNLQLQNAEDALKERLVYRLRQNYCKLRRRKANRMVVDGPTIDDVYEASGVSLPWLVNKCSKELHLYARLRPNRPMDVLPFSKEWNENVGSILLEFVQNHISTTFVAGQRNGVANVGLVQSLRGEGEESGSTSIDLEAIQIKLVSILRERGNPVGGLDVGNIMTDAKMRRLLGGRDLTTVIRENSAAFESFVETYQDELRNNVWYVQLADGSGDTSKGTSGVKRKKDLLDADEIGTYSLTDATSALAMAKVLAGAFDRDEGSKVARSTVAIDMTAGVGGNTIGLCKVFQKVIAYEIDEHRIEYLKRNISERVDASAVDVTLRRGDSVQAMDSLQAELREDGFDVSKQVAVIIDPPFGGTHYRRQGGKMVLPIGEDGGKNDYDDEGLRLGDMALSEVVKVVMRELKPCAIGIKLPLSFDVNRFAERLVGGSKAGNGGVGRSSSTTEDGNEDEDEEMELQIKAIRRLSRNLFVVVKYK